MSVTSDSDTPITDDYSDTGPASPSPSPPPMPPVRLPDAHLDPPPQSTILEIWEAEQEYINSGPTAGDTPLPAAPQPRRTALQTWAQSTITYHNALVAQRRAENNGYACLLRLEAYLTTHRAECGATADAILPTLAEHAWDRRWLAEQRTGALMRRAPGVVAELLQEQTVCAAAAVQADANAERAMTARARRERVDGAVEDVGRLGEIRAGIRDAERRKEEKASRPPAWYEIAERLAESTQKVDEWYHDFVKRLRWWYKEREVVVDAWAWDEESSDDEGTVVWTEDEDSYSRRVWKALLQPKVAHMGMMGVLGWTEEDLQRMSESPVASTTSSELSWDQFVLESIPYAGRTIEAFHNAVHALKGQNDRHGVPIGDTSALNRVGDIAIVYDRWLMSRITTIAKHVSERHTQMLSDHSFLRTRPLHITIREAFASLLEPLTNPTAASLNSISFRQLLAAIEAIVATERADYEVRPDHDTLVAVHCLLHLHRYARRWRDRTMWLHGNMSQETVHAYRTRAVRAALGRWVHWSQQAKLAVDSAHDAALGLERHSSAAKDILRALRTPKPILNRLLDLAKYGRLMGVAGGHVGEMLAYAIVWDRKKETMRKVTTEVMVHHASAEMDYLASTLPDVVQSMADSPQFGETGEESMAVRIGRWVVPSLWEWNKRPENDRPVGARTLLILHFAKLVERLASMSDTTPVPEDQERVIPQLTTQLRYDECDETVFRAMADRWQNARLRLTGRVREYVLRHQDAMIERASAMADEKATTILDEVQGGRTTASAALQVLKKHSLLPTETQRNLSSALADGLEAPVHKFLRENRDTIIRRAKLMKTEEIATMLSRMATPGRELKVALQDLSDHNLVPLDKNSPEYLEHQFITTNWNQVLRAELILAHVCGVVGPAWKNLPAYVGPSLIRAFDHYCP